MGTISHIALFILLVIGAVIGLALAFDKPDAAHKFIHGSEQRRPLMGHTGGVVPYLARYQAHNPFYGRHRVGHNYGNLATGRI